MARTNVGPDHVVAGIIHTQIQREAAEPDQGKAFFALINAPGTSFDLPLQNGASIDRPISSGAMHGDLHVEVDDFRLVPAGATAATATALACKVVFKLRSFFSVTLGSIDVTAALK